MQRLLDINLTEVEKAYLRERSLSGVCSSKNGHECYIGKIFSKKLFFTYRFFLESKVWKFLRFCFIVRRKIVQKWSILRIFKRLKKSYHISKKNGLIQCLFFLNAIFLKKSQAMKIQSIVIFALLFADKRSL